MKFLKNLIRASAVAALVAGAATATQAADISGAGATFPYPIYAKWADAYKKETGIGLNYQSIGSGGGIKQIKARTVTFGATDAPLPGKELDESGLVQFPMVMGAIVPVVNLEGVKPGDMVLDGDTLDFDGTRVRLYGIDAFEREALATSGLSSPHSIELYDFGITDEGTFYYVMELLEVDVAWHQDPTPDRRVGVFEGRRLGGHRRARHAREAIASGVG